MLMYVLQEAAAKQAAWEQEQARIARERHLKEVEEFKASEALAGAAVARGVACVKCDVNCTSPTLQGGSGQACEGGS
jgi:hypothetical protein